jgi:hypothetical protein
MRKQNCFLKKIENRKIENRKIAKRRKPKTEKRETRSREKETREIEVRQNILKPLGTTKNRSKKISSGRGC